MGLSKFILSLSVYIIKLFTFWLPQDRNRITCITCTGKELTGDMEQVYNYLETHTNYKLKKICYNYKPTIKSKLGYFWNCLHQYIALKRSKLVIINDNNYIISRHKPKHTQVIQLWHACGAVKKCGNQTKRAYKIKNYDIVTATSPAWRDVYTQAFNVNRWQVHVTGMPRIDYFLSDYTDKIAAFYDKYPMLKDKKIVLYAPTFRGTTTKKDIHLDVPNYADLLSKLNTDTNDYAIVCKYHPLLQIKTEQTDTIIDCSGEDLYTLMHICDCLITDYSSIIFDYSLLGKPCILYVPDLDNYTDNVGLNLTIDELQDFATVIKSEEDLPTAIQGIDTTTASVKAKEFANKYMPNADTNNCKRVCELIEQRMTYY
jgi:CDP-ribitol ribitolphosphotransferase